MMVIGNMLLLTYFSFNFFAISYIRYIIVDKINGINQITIKYPIHVTMARMVMNIFCIF